MHLTLTTLDELFDAVHDLYDKAIALTASGVNDNISRHHQHSISSVLEDLLAVLLSNILTPEFPKEKPHFFVDVGIQVPGVGKMRPDIAIVITKPKPMLVAYIDVKTDLGFNREYYESFPEIVRKLNLLKGTSPNIANIRKVEVSRDLRWKTVFISEDNAPGKVQLNKTKAQLYTQDFELYFLSGGNHPNRKLRDKVKPYEIEFARLLNSCRSDIKVINEK